MKAVYTLVLMMLVLAASAFSQSYTWQHMGIFPPSHGVAGDTLFGNGMHGLAVDGAGKIWAQHYYAVATRDSLLIPNYMADLDTVGGVDSIVAKKIAVRALYVFNPDGTQPAWSPLKTITLPGGKVDTIAGYSVYVKGKKVWHPTLSSRGAGVGLRNDWQGNIIAVWYNDVYKIDYKTGAGLMKFTVPSNGSCVAPGVDQDGNVFINRVVAAGLPIWVFDNNGTFLQNARDTSIMPALPCTRSSAIRTRAGLASSVRGTRWIVWSRDSIASPSAGIRRPTSSGWPVARTMTCQTATRASPQIMTRQHGMPTIRRPVH
jgi:hypothetical protein